MDMAKLEGALFFIVRLIVVIVPYTFIAVIVGNVPFWDQVRAELYITLGGVALFFLDLFLQTFLDQDLIGKIVYVAIIGGLIVFSLYFLYPTYFLFLRGREDMFVKIFSGGQVFLLTYFVYISFKKFFVILWDLDIA